MDSVLEIRTDLDSLIKDISLGAVPPTLLAEMTIAQIRAILLLVEAVENRPLRLFAADARELDAPLRSSYPPWETKAVPQECEPLTEEQIKAACKKIQDSVLPDGTKGSDFISTCPYCDKRLPLVYVGGQVRRADHECEGVETK